MKITGRYFLAFAALFFPILASAAPPVGRERIQFDAGWRFHKGGFQNENEVAVTGWRWKADDQGAATALPESGAEAGWQAAAPGLDTFHGRRGFAWYRVALPNIRIAGRTLHFESVDDNATVYLNGKNLTHHEGWNEPFDVPLDSAWNTNGSNIVTVLVENTDGAGGIGAVSLQNEQAKVDSGPAAEDYDDKSWRLLHLPHDFVVEGQFTPTADAGHGSLPTDIGWYRKTFTIPTSDKGRRLWVDFDGVYRNSMVWLNGHLLGNHKSGYTGFRYDITDLVKYGGKNTLAVRADARAQEGWWYEGGGIYRHVWLTKAPAMHIAPEGVYVLPSLNADGSADVVVRVTLNNQGGKAGTYDVSDLLLSPGGKEGTVTRRAVVVNGDGMQEVTLTTKLDHPELWSLESPRMYECRVLVEKSDGVPVTPVDTVSVPFGIRTIKFDAEKGFFLNGKHVEIQGTCNHQDFAGVGTAMPDSVLEWRIRKLKEMGCNACRMSHNPPAKELLDACDRLGMLVMDENRHLGDTYRDHSPRGTPYSDLSDLREMIVRDRNHPSIIMWSMCNEEGLQGSPEGGRIFAAMKKAVLELDASRPVTCAMNGGWGYGISLVEDLQGCNYNPGSYSSYHQQFPDQPAYGSETASAVSTRGEYVNDPVKGYVSAYDVNAPSWAQPAEVAWKALVLRPFMAGGYVWTGFDYKGEPTPYGWPCINSHFGIMDECGFPKDTYYYYQSWWSGKDVIHLLPHWNWPGKEGQPIDVWCHSNADKVELLLNGVSLGTKDMPRYGHLEWKVPYAPGKLEARGYRDGKVVMTDIVETTDAPSQLRLSTDRTTLRPDSEDATMVKVEVLDAKGRVVPYAADEITFTTKGPAQVVGVGNGDPSSHEPDRAANRHAFHGLTLAVVQAGEKTGKVELTASAPGLQRAHLTLDVRK